MRPAYYFVKQEQAARCRGQKNCKVLFYVLTIYYNRVIIRYRKKEEDKMRKLDNKQKEMIMNRFVYAYRGVKTTTFAQIIIMNVEKYGKEQNKLEEDIDLAIDITREQAQ
jgi:hypothetical protein